MRSCLAGLLVLESLSAPQPLEQSLKDVLEEHLVAGKGLAWHTVQVGVNSAEQDKLPLCKERDGGAWKQVVSDE